jgi:protocatechuate 3,4-dioxygenase beta subunit
VLLTSTTQAALAIVRGEETAGMVSAHVGELMKSAAPVVVSKTKIATAVLLAASLLAGAGAWICRTLATPQAAARPVETPPAPSPSKPEPPPVTKSEAVTVKGRVFDPDGQPVRGAKLLFIYGSGKAYPHKVWAVSTAEGGFAFTVPVKDVDNGYSEKPWEYTYVVAAAEGYGFAAARVGKPGADDLMLRLVKDDVPLRGRVLDIQGRPVAGARVRIADTLRTPTKGDLTAWLAALKANKEDPGTVEWHHLTALYSPAFDLLFPPVMTGPDGRFQMKGIGGERLAYLRIEGPTIATQEVPVMTRASEEVRLPLNKENPKWQTITYYGAGFDLLAAPSRPVVGIVRDKDTGKPLAGVTIASSNAFRSDFIRTTTDKEGRYRLDGLPKGDGNKIAARANDYLPPSGNEMSSQRPYLSAVKKVDNPLGLEPVTVDFALKRGVWVKGRVTDKATGKPLWASIEYFCFSDNPNAKEIAFAGNRKNWRSSREDGSFLMPVLPGRGLIAVRAYQDHYIMGVGADRIKGPRTQDSANYFITKPYLCFPGNFHTLVEIDPKTGQESITCDVTLDPGRTLKGTVLGPDGKPLAGARVSGLKPMGYWENKPLSGADFTLESLKPNKARLLQFRHEGKKLSGSLLIRGDEKDPVRVRLERWGTLTGRIITPLGNPLTSARVDCWTEVNQNGSIVYESFQHVQPDKDGRFRIEGLAAGMKYKLGVTRSNIAQNISGGEPKDLTIKAGETKDLGDLTVKPME